MVVTPLVPLLFSACTSELAPSAPLAEDVRLAVLPPEATVVFHLAPGRFVADLEAAGLPEGLDLADASAVGGCGPSGCLALVEAAPGLLNPAASPGALVPSRLDRVAPDGTPLVWRVLGPGKAVLGDAPAVAEAWQGVQAEAPGFDAAPWAEDVPAGESWLLVVDAEAFGEQAARRLDRLAKPGGHAVGESLARFDTFWPGLRARSAAFAMSFDDEAGLLRARVRCHSEADAVAVEAEAWARAGFSPFEVASIRREGVRVEITVQPAGLL